MDEQGFAALAAKAGLLWVAHQGRQPRPVWFSWHEAAVHAVVGGPEQPDPFSPDGSTAVLTIPGKDTFATAATAEVQVHDLHPGTAAWHAAADSLSGRRLNSVAGDLVELWATKARIVRLEVRAVHPEPVPEQNAGARPVDVAGVRPRTWRSMRAHARSSSARTGKLR